MRKEINKDQKKVKTAAVLILSLCLLINGGYKNLNAAVEDPLLEMILQELRTYEPGGNDDILLQLRDYVYEHRNDPEGREACEKALIAFLDSEATTAAKMEVCRHLRTIGSERAVSALQRMLLKTETSDIARYTLEKIPGHDVDVILLQAMNRSQGGIKLGLISTLGHRRTADAVPALLKLAAAPDPKMAEAALAALGNIASSEAAAGLTKILKSSQGEPRIQTGAALLACAETLRAGDRNNEASEIYAQIIGSQVPLAQQQAALIGTVELAGPSSEAVVLEVLKGGNADLFAVAIGVIPDTFTANNVSKLCALQPQLPAENQVQLLAALSHYKDALVKKTAVQALSSQDPDVRIAALKALSKIGDASTVKILVQHAAESRGTEQLAARSSLWGLGAKGVDVAVLDALKSEGSSERQRELLRAVGERRILPGKDLLFTYAQTGDSRNRVEAMRSLRTVAISSDLPRLLDVLLATTENTERQSMTSTVAVVAGRIVRPDSRGLLVVHKLSQTEDIPARCDLYRVLGKIGDTSTLPLLRQALANTDADIQDAAVRALAEWPGPEPRTEVLRIAQTSQNPTHQVLSLQAYIRMVGLEEYDSPEEAVQLLQMCIPQLKRAEEKKALLGLLPNYPCQEALEMAESFLSEEAVIEEAEVAVARIKDRLEY